MGKRWRHYQIGPYTLGSLNGQAVATWRGEHGNRHRERLGAATTEAEARAIFSAWVSSRNSLKAERSVTVSQIFAAYQADRSIDLARQEPENPLSKATRKGRARAVYINDWARAALAEAREGRLSEYVIEWNGEPVRCIRTGFRAACRRAGIDHVTPHDLRRTAATWLADQRIDMERIARFLGHSDPQVTRSTYAHPKADKEAAEVVQLRRRS